MFQNWLLFSLYFLIGGVYLFAGTLWADDPLNDLKLHELEQQRQQKIRQKRNAQKKRNQVAGKEQGVLKRLQEIEAKMGTLQFELEHHQDEIEVQKRKKKEREVELSTLRDRYLNYQRQASKRIASIYKMGYRSAQTNQHQLVKLLMSSEGLTDLLTKYKYANLIAKFDQQILANLMIQQEKIKSTYTKLQKQVAAIEATTQAIQVKQENLLTSKRKRQKLLSDYRTQRSTYDQVIKELRQAVVDLEEALGILSTDTLMVKADRIKSIGIKDKGKLPRPVRGKIIKNQNPFDRGITIKPDDNNKKPLRVRSVAQGVVGKVINSVVGYGNAILILHGNAHTSVYTHLSVVEVKVGDLVAKNQIIGQVGESGSLIGQVLYFELWHNYVPLDTAQWLKP